MLNFYRKSLQEDAEKFVEQIKKDSQKLDKESQKFIEDLFLNEKDNTYYSYGGYLRSLVKRELASKKDVKFNDIFPKNIYPAMELLSRLKSRTTFLKSS